MTILDWICICDCVLLAIGSSWIGGGPGIICLCECLHMAIGSSSSSTPLSILGASVGVKSSACLGLDTTLGGGLAQFLSPLRPSQYGWVAPPGADGLVQLWLRVRLLLLLWSQPSMELLAYHLDCCYLTVSFNGRGSINSRSGFSTPCMMWSAGVLVGMVRWWCRNSSVSDTLVALVPLAMMF